MRGYVLHSFDVIDVGHIDLVHQVRERCSHVVVGVLTDDEVRTITGREPVVPLTERVALASHLRGVDRVVVHDLTAVPDDAEVYVEHGDGPPWPGATPLVPRVRTSSTLLVAGRAGRRQLADRVAEQEVA